jgi:hypothetical protein
MGTEIDLCRANDVGRREVSSADGADTSSTIKTLSSRGHGQAAMGWLNGPLAGWLASSSNELTMEDAGRPRGGSATQGQRAGIVSKARAAQPFGSQHGSELHDAPWPQAS